ncbi:hypothetical protein [Pseudoduganella violaceinigra]|uniref:hypothetical protein n=1 Tax=Pseudoduganella violaceinigra TaxID=246602 RepID=UPI000686AF20|nr:hypothetical protein [Pseudoduganella violaceinigra]
MNYARLTTAVLLAFLGAAQADEQSLPPVHPALQALNDGELRAVTRPLPWRMPADATTPGTGSLHTALPPRAARSPIIGYLRALNLLTTDIEIRDVDFGNNMPTWTAAGDGSYRVPLPATIGEVDLRNIRCNPNDSLHFGSLQILGIDLQNTTITVSRTK